MRSAAVIETALTAKSPLPDPAYYGDTSASSGNSLLVALQKTYKDRWAILLDSVFSNETAQRVTLLNPFIQAKIEGPELLKLHDVSIKEAPGSEMTISSRHLDTGLLTKYWTHLSAVLPAFVCTPEHGDRILVLGKPSFGRLLTIIQLLLNATPEDQKQKSQGAASTPSSRSQGKRSKEMPSKRSFNAALEPPASKARVDKRGCGEGGRIMFEEYSHLPWHVYGEGEPPVGWQTGQQSDQDGSFVVQVQNGLVPVKPPQGWTLGNLLTGMLQRGIKAGCCVVRTSSGDWAEACAQEAQRVQEAQKQEASDPTAQASSGTPSHSRCRSCFTSTMCLGDDGTYEPLVDAPQEGSDPATQNVPIQLHCYSPDESASQQLQQLVENHVPQQICRSISIKTATGSESQPWWKPATDGSFDCVIVEAEATATKSAVLSACQLGDKQAWLVGAAKKLLQTQAQMLSDAFYALRPGGHLLFCSSSLAYEETDGLMKQCAQDLQGRAYVVEAPIISNEADAEAIRIAMKKWGAEKTEFGWRLLPDLSFQNPQYFSVMHRL